MTIDSQTEQHIEAQARESAAELRAQGWTAPASMYDVGVHHGDRDALVERLGRAAALDELCALEKAIRAELGGAS